MRSGEIRRNAKARLLRDGVVIDENLPISSLRRFKDDVVEVREGFECGIGLGTCNDIKVGDVIETYEMRGEAAGLTAWRWGRPSRRRPRQRSSYVTSEHWSWTSCSGTCTR